jgi:hypothetical protein
MEWKSVITNSDLNEHSVITNRFISQIWISRNVAFGNYKSQNTRKKKTALKLFSKQETC